MKTSPRHLHSTEVRALRSRLITGVRLATVAALVTGVGVLIAPSAGAVHNPVSVKTTTQRATHRMITRHLSAEPKLLPHGIHLVITVNNFGDNPSFQSCAGHNANTCSFRAAVLAANSNTGYTDEIVVPAHHTILLTQNTTIDLENNMVIEAPGVVLEGNDSSGIFYLDDPWSVTMVGLRVEKGDASYGGGMDCANGSLLLDDVDFTDNVAGIDGGAVYSSGGCSLWIDNSNFPANVAYGTSDNEGGGAIYAFGNAQITRTTIGGTLGASGNRADYGAGIYSYDGSVAITNCAIEHNAPLAGGYGEGVGIYDDEDVDISNSTISHNTAPDGGDGVGVYNDYYLKMSNITLVGNNAAGANSSSGTGLYTDGSTTLLYNVSFTGTATTPSGGHDVEGAVVYAYYDSDTFDWIGGTVSNTINGLTGQSDEIEGGALYLGSDDVALTGVTISNTLNRSLPEEEVEGGAIYIYDYAHLENDKIIGTNNSGDYVEGGAVDVDEGEADLNGVSVANTTNLASYANSPGGTINGGAINTDKESSIILSNVAITNTKNTANLASEATPSDFESEIYGGGVNLDEDSVLQANGLSIVGGVDVASGGDGHVYGGGIYLDGEGSADNTQVLDFIVKADAYVAGGLVGMYAQFSAINLTLGDSNVRVLGGPEAGDPSSDGSILYTDGTFNLINGTIDNNTTQVPDSGQYNWGVEVQGTAQYSDTTMANDSDLGPKGATTLLGVYQSTVSLRNTIIDSTATNLNCLTNDGSILSQGNNIDSGKWCHFSQLGDQQLMNPKVLKLANNGGAVWTAALSPTSPAINRGSDIGCYPTDARGIVRPQGSACDVGSYEYVAPPVKKKK